MFSLEGAVHREGHGRQAEVVRAIVLVAQALHLDPWLVGDQWLELLCVDGSRNVHLGIALGHCSQPEESADIPEADGSQIYHRALN